MVGSDGNTSSFVVQRKSAQEQELEAKEELN